jgi:hypothetical protein
MKSLESRKRPLHVRSTLMLALSCLGCGLGISACSSEAPEVADAEDIGSLSQAMGAGVSVQVTFSSEYLPKNAGWFTNNWEGSITYKLDPQANLTSINPDGAHGSGSTSTASARRWKSRPCTT